MKMTCTVSTKGIPPGTYFGKPQRRAFLRTVIIGAQSRILKRIRKGIDYKGNKFKKYSPAYKAWKKTKGIKYNTRRKSNAIKTNVRSRSSGWLRLSGLMLQSMNILKSDHNECILGFIGTENKIKAYANQYNYGRKFMALDEQGFSEAYEKAKKHLAAKEARRLAPKP